MMELNTGLSKNSLINHKDGYIILSDLNIEFLLPVLNDSDSLKYLNIVSKNNFISKGVQIEFEDNSNLICTEFFSFFSLLHNKFINAHQLKNGYELKTIDGSKKVKKISFVDSESMIEINFENNSSFFVNDLLCHCLSEISDYDNFINNSENKKISNLFLFKQLIYPHHDYNYDLMVEWKYSASDKWRKAFYLLDFDFDPSSTGFSYSKNKTLEIRIHTTETLKDKYIAFHGFGSTFCECFSEDVNKKTFSDGHRFLIIFEKIIFENPKIYDFIFKSSDNCTLTNCIILNQSEYESILNNFTGYML